MLAAIVIGAGLIALAASYWPKRAWPKEPTDIIRRRGQFRDG